MFRRKVWRYQRCNQKPYIEDKEGNIIQWPTKEDRTKGQTIYICTSYEFEPRSWLGALDVTLCNKVCQWLATDRWFYPVSSNNKTDRHDIAEILLKVPLNTINQAHTHIYINGLKLVNNQSYRMLVSQRTWRYCTNKKIGYILYIQHRHLSFVVIKVSLPDIRREHRHHTKYYVYKTLSFKGVWLSSWQGRILFVRVDFRPYKIQVWVCHTCYVQIYNMCYEYTALEIRMYNSLYFE